MHRRRLPRLPATVRWALVLLVAGGIALASVAPPSGLRGALGPLGLVGVDTWLHAGSYLLLALVLGYALLESRFDRVLATVFATAVGYGTAMELVQTQLDYRTFSLVDIVANGLGATLAAAVWWVVLTSARIRVRPVGEGEDGRAGP